MSEQLEFSRSIEGLFIKGLGPLLTPSLKEQLRKAGLDIDKTLLPAYPAADFHRWLQVAAKALYPDDSLEEALRKLGHCAVAGLQDTIIGRALTAGLKLLGPRRSLERVHRVFRNNGNYQEASIVELTEKSATIHIHYVFGVPTYYQGLFEFVLNSMEAKNVKVTVVPSPPPGAVIHIEWSL